MQNQRLPLLTRIRVSPPVNWLRYHAYRDVLLACPRRHECNLCGWRGRRFPTYKHKHVLCPQCGPHVRQRLIAAAARLDGVGFSVSVVEADDLDAEYVHRHVLRPPVPLSASYGWERRRIYFAWRPS